jgi:hypothetical protein
MNHYSGIEMAKQRQAEFQREANLHRIRVTKTLAPARTTRFPRLAIFGRAGSAGAESPRTRREWRLSQP